MSFFNIFGLVWSLPGSLIGLLLSLFLSPKRITRSGTVFLVEVERLLPNFAKAQTWGHVILFKNGISKKTIIHELKHVEQWNILGPFFLLAYPLASLVASLRGGHYYRDNEFEQRARAHADREIHK